MFIRGGEYGRTKKGFSEDIGYSLKEEGDLGCWRVPGEGVGGVEKQFEERHRPRRPLKKENWAKDTYLLMVDQLIQTGP